jgi:hypothetical protein
VWSELSPVVPFCRHIFNQNVKTIEAHNAGEHGWTMAVNKFADLVGEEFKARFASGYRYR